MSQLGFNVSHEAPVQRPAMFLFTPKQCGFILIGVLVSVISQHVEENGGENAFLSKKKKRMHAFAFLKRKLQ